MGPLLAVLAGAGWFSSQSGSRWRERFSAPTVLQLNGPSIHRALTRGSTQNHAFRVTANQYVRLEAKQLEIDINLRIFGPQQQVIVEMNGSPYGTEAVSFVSPVSGMFEVIVSALEDSTDRGEYYIKISEQRPAAPGDESQKEAHRLFREAFTRSSGSKKELDEAIAFSESAALLWETAGERVRSAHARMLLATLCALTGQWGRADSAYANALALFGEVRDEPGRLNVLRALGRLTGHFSIKTAGVPDDEEFIRLWRAVGDRRGIAASISALASQRLFENRFPDALKLEEEALRLRTAIGDQEGRLRSLNAIVKIDVCLKKFGPALLMAHQILRQRQQRGDKRGEAAAFGTLAWVSETNGELADAAKYYSRASALHHEQGDISAEAAKRGELAGVFYRIGDFRKARENLLTALALRQAVEDSIRSPARKAGYDSRADVITSLIHVLGRMHKDDPAAGYDREAFAAADRSYSLYLREVRPSSRKSLEDIQRALPNDTVFLQYWLGPEWSWLWCVSSDRILVRLLPSQNEINELSKKTYNAVVARSLDLSRESVGEVRSRLARADQEALLGLQRLSHRLLEPVASELNRRRILVVGDPTIQRIPLSLLPDPLSRDGAPMISQHELTYLPSAEAAVTHVIVPSTKPAKDSSFMIVADPVTSGMLGLDSARRAAPAPGASNERLPRLRYAWQEAQEIARWHSPQNIRRLTGQNATRAAVLSGDLANSRFIHFATHAFINSNDPESSGLVLSTNRDGVDGYLRLGEIQNLRLRAELVVLSACQTASGPEPWSGGVVSLSSAFLRAGASKVLSTAWKVDDEATAFFMKLFYQALFHDGRSAAVALREAQMTMARSDRWHGFYYWGGFVLYGSWRE